MLNPKWCISVASNSSNCMHKSVFELFIKMSKLMMNSLAIKIDYQNLIDEIICHRKSNICMLRDCEKCPSKENLRNKLFSIFNSKEQYISYKEWQATDCTEII